MNPKSNPISISSFPSNHGFHPDFDFLHVDPLDSDSDAPISQWELVNPSDADDPFDFDYLSYDEHFVTSGSVVAVKFLPLVEVSSVGDSPPLIDQYISSAEAEITDSVIAGNVDVDGNGYEHCYEDDEDEEEEYDDGLDDELVPRHMRGKLGRERIRKLGNRGCSKMNTSKKSPFLFVKRGCLHGKHGFGIGLKNSL